MGTIITMVVVGSNTGVVNGTWPGVCRFKMVERDEKIATILGNGSSNSFYQPSKGFVVACNVPQHPFAYDAITIIDRKPVDWMQDNNWHPKVPVWCSRTVSDYANKKKIQGMWQVYYAEPHQTNTAIHAVEHLCQHDYTQIHFYGFNSFYSDDYVSQMDKIMPRPPRPNLNKRWKPHWNRIFSEHNTVTFVMHIPKGTNHDFTQENIKTRHH